MGRQDSGESRQEYAETAIYQAVKPDASLAAADLRYNAWVGSPGHQAYLSRAADAKVAAREAKRQAELAEVEQILARARERKASEATAITGVAELADDQREQIGRAVTGTV